MSRMQRTESVGDSLCPVCHEHSEIYAIGPCDHPICYRCSTRMRVLCNQMYCPICRGDLPQVVFLTEKKKYDTVDRRNCIPNRKFKILCEDESVEEAYEALLEHRCRVCDKGPLFDSFPQMQTHMRKAHTLFACDLCISHLKIFTFERRFYSRKDIAVHRRNGDPDNRSYRGHPLCQFCDERYFDNDELHRHLRKDHFYCHFCDASSNTNEYYSDYADLKYHFKTKHFLCEEGVCGSPQTRFTHAFASEIDLKAHVASEHLGNKSKAQARELRTLDISFQYAPRRRGRDAAGITADDYEDSDTSRRRQRYHRNRDEPQRESKSVAESQMSRQEQETARAVVPVMDDFPTLSGHVPAPATQASVKRTAEEDFPALSSNRRAAPVAPVTSASVARSTAGKAQPTQASTAASQKPGTFSKLVNSTAPVSDSGRPRVTDVRPASSQTAPTYVSQQWAAPRIASGEDFPALGGDKQSKTKVDGPNLVSLGAWSRKNKEEKSGQPSSASSGKHSAPAPIPTSLAALGRSLCDDREFPSLGGGARPVQSSGWVGKKNSQSSASNSKTSKSASSKDSRNISPPAECYYVLNGNKDDKTEETRSKTEETRSKKKKKQKEGKKPENPAEDKNSRSEQTSLGGKSGVNGHVNSDDDVPLSWESLEAGDSVSKSAVSESKSGEEENDQTQSVMSKGPERSSPVEAIVEDEPFQVVPSKGKKGKQFLEDDFPALTSSKAAPSVTPVSQPPPPVPPPPTSQAVRVGEEKENRKQQKGSGFKSFREEDFPVLQAVQTTAPPPGFKKPSKVSAPPGLKKPVINQPRVPPGLSSPPPVISDSAPAIPMAVKLNMYTYVDPNDSCDRNRELVAKVRKSLILKDDCFDQFRSLSGEFRSGQVSAAEYYRRCKDLFGTEKFLEVFPELVALLPDILKQHELAQAHLQDKSGAASPLSLTSCPTCHQLLQVTDLPSHLTAHTNLGTDISAASLQACFSKQLPAASIST